MPLFFVFLWATGFINARMALPYMEPLSFLTIRFGSAALLLTLWLLLARVSLKMPLMQAVHWAITGTLLHALYIGSAYLAIWNGVEAGTSALVAGLQPMVVILLAWMLLQERLNTVQMLGVLMGIIGVFLVSYQKFSAGFGTPLGFTFAALQPVAAGIAVIWQKRYCITTDIRKANAVQFGAAALLLAIGAALTETQQITWSPELGFAMFWAIFVLSILSVAVYQRLMQSGDASRIGSLFFLTPVAAAIMGWLLFAEQLGFIGYTGFAITVLGVALVNRTSN